MKIENNVFIITGAGSGIGRQLTLQMLEKKAKIAAIDINESFLNEIKVLAKDKIQNLSIHVVDISNKRLIEQLPNEILNYHGSIDAIVNNAGIIQPFKKFEELSYEFMEKIFNINFWGSVYMIKTFIPYLINRPEAYIVNVSSMGGFMPFPYQSIYGASKAALKLLTEALYAELKNSNIKVCIIFPGAIATDIAKNSGIEISSNNSNKLKYKPLSAEKAASQIINAIEKDKFNVYIGKDSKLMNVIYRINPKFAIDTITKQMSKLFQNKS